MNPFAIQEQANGHEVVFRDNPHYAKSVVIMYNIDFYHNERVGMFDVVRIKRYVCRTL